MMKITKRQMKLHSVINHQLKPFSFMYLNLNKVSFIVMSMQKIWVLISSKILPFVCIVTTNWMISLVEITSTVLLCLNWISEKVLLAIPANVGQLPEELSLSVSCPANKHHCSLVVIWFWLQLSYPTYTSHSP